MALGFKHEEIDKNLVPLERFILHDFLNDKIHRAISLSNIFK